MVHAKGCPPLCTPGGARQKEFLPSDWVITADCGTKAQLILTMLSRATSLVSNGNIITSRVSLSMKMRQILSASTTLSCRIGVIFVCISGGQRQKRGKSEENTR